MSKMSDLVLSIQEDLEKGVLSFAEIAQKHEVPTSWVDEVAREYATFGLDQVVIENDYMDDF